jgi:hypothetical protein
MHTGLYRATTSATLEPRGALCQACGDALITATVAVQTSIV